MHRSPNPFAAAAILVCASSVAPAAAQAPDRVTVADSVGRLLHHAAVRGDRAGLLEARGLAERAVTALGEDGLLVYHMGEAHYRLATLLFGAEPDSAAFHLERAAELLGRSVELQPLAEAHALLSTVLGMQIGSNPLKGMILGPRSGRELDRALALGPENPRVWLVKGSSELNKPKLFGGGAEPAVESLRQATALFDRDDPEPGLPRWGRAEVWAWLGQAYAALGRTTEARDAYERALEIEAAYAWVRHALLPALEREAPSAPPPG
jgi:tetratricopeptide (TPR) repeat protein